MSNFAENIADLTRVAVHPDVLRANMMTGGEVFLVLEDSDTDFNLIQQRFGGDNVFTTLEAAYAAAVTNRNDIILMSAQSSHVVAAGMDWSKNRIHVVGMDGGDRLIQPGTKVQSTGNPATAYLMKVTGTRNSFRNMKFIQNSTNAAAITCVQDGGEGTLFKNCQFIFGTATNIDGTETTSYEFVAGGDSCTYLNCEFGTPTLAGDGARAVMAISRVNGTQECKDCRWKDCVWVIASETASADMIRVTNTNAAKFTNIFINPIFQAVITGSASLITLDDAVRSVTGLQEGELLFVNPASNCTEFCSDVTDQVKVIGWGLDGTTPAQKIGIALTPS